MTTSMQEQRFGKSGDKDIRRSRVAASARSWRRGELEDGVDEPRVNKQMTGRFSLISPSLSYQDIRQHTRCSRATPPESCGAGNNMGARSHSRIGEDESWSRKSGEAARSDGVQRAIHLAFLAAAIMIYGLPIRCSESWRKFPNFSCNNEFAFAG